MSGYLMIMGDLEGFGVTTTLRSSVQWFRWRLRVAAELFWTRPPKLEQLDITGFGMVRAEAPAAGGVPFGGAFSWPSGPVCHCQGTAHFWHVFLHSPAKLSLVSSYVQQLRSGRNLGQAFQNIDVA